jgi:hypothetical protein
VFLTSFFAQKNLREVKKRKIRFLEYSFLDYLIGRDGSSGIHPNSHPFAPKKQSMMSLKSVELKLGAKEPLAEEAK